MGARFAERYLEYRSRLASLLREVSELSERSQTSVEGLLEMQAELEDRISIVTLGNELSGRSSFLDNILGSKVSKSLKSKRAGALQFRSKEDELTIENLEVNYQQSDELYDFLCIKPLSLDKSKAEDYVITEKSISEADLCYWIISVEDPWSNSFWQMLEKQSAEVLGQSMIVVNKVDLLSQQDLTLMLGHLEDLMLQRLGFKLPLYTASNESGILQGYSEIWEQSNYALDNIEDRKKYLSQVKDKLKRVLDLIERTVDDRARTLDGDKGFLASLESDIARLCQRETQLYAGEGVTLSSSYSDQINVAKSKFSAACSVLPTTVNLFLPGAIGEKPDQFFIDSVAKSYVSSANNDCQKILLDCKEHWRQGQHHLDERLGGNAGDFQEEGFHFLLEELLERQEAEVRDVMGSMRLRIVFEHILKPRRKLLKNILTVMFIFLIIAGILGVFDVPPQGVPALVVLIFALATLCYYLFVIFATRRALSKTLEDRLLAYQSLFSEQLIEPYKDMIHKFFNGYAPMFLDMRSRIAEAKESLDPLQKEHHDLYLKLLAIESEFER